MAKKSGFNMSAEVRALLQKNNQLTGPEIYATLSKKFPGQKINKNSCQVAFANARKKMGLTRKSSKSGKPIYRKVAKPSSDRVSLSALRSARELLARTDGDLSLATAILREVKALQG